MTLFRWLMVAALLVPWLARAGDADDFAAASRSTQAALLQTWATARTPRVCRCWSRLARRIWSLIRKSIRSRSARKG